MASSRPGARLRTLIVLLVIFGSTAFMVFQFFVAGGFSSVGGAYSVRAEMPSSSQLTPAARVTMAGVPVGKVDSIDVSDQGVIVSMNITEDDVTPIPTDSKVSLRGRTALGENYVEITPGTARETLESEGVLPVEQADEFVDVDEILSLLDGGTRERAQEFFQSVGGSMDGRGQELNKVFDSTALTFQEGGELTQAIYGSREQASRLVDQFGDVTRTIGDRGDAIRDLFARGRVALSSIADRDDALRATFDQLPPTLARLRQTSNVLNSATGQIAPVFRDLAGAVRTLRPGIENLTPASRGGRAVLTELAAASAPLRGTLQQVRQLSGPATRALPQVRRMLCQAAPTLDYLEPYAPEILGTFVGLGSASNSYDATGHLIRVTPLISENSAPGLPDDVSKAIFTLREAGFAGKSTGFGWDPYPAPGSLDDTTRGLGVIGPSEWPGTYPRIEARKCAR